MTYTQSKGLSVSSPLSFDIFNANSLNLVAVALVASLASYLNRHVGGPDDEPKKFNWLKFLAHLLASTVSAILASNLAIMAGVDSDRALSAVAGVCGWAGKEGIDWIIYALRMKALNVVGLSKAADRETHSYNGSPTKRHGGYSDYTSDTTEISESVKSLRKKKTPEERAPEI